MCMHVCTRTQERFSTDAEVAWLCFLVLSGSLTTIYRREANLTGFIECLCTAVINKALKRETEAAPEEQARKPSSKKGERIRGHQSITHSAKCKYFIICEDFNYFA